MMMSAFTTPTSLQRIVPSTYQTHLKHAPICGIRRTRRWSLPPTIPPTKPAQDRAIQLLGNYTQRQASEKIIAQLTTLLGESPKSKEEAGNWKRGLQRKTQKKQAPPRPSHETRIFATQVHLPNCGEKSDRQLGRAFSLLESVRRQLNRRRVLSAEIREELLRLVGVVPKSEREVLVISRTLSTLAFKRRCAEREPTRYPTEGEDLQVVSMLLGSFAHRGSVGEQTEILHAHLGGLPRTRNIARSWKKLVDRKRVRLVRQKRSALRRAKADEVRRQRKQWRELPQWARNVVVFGRGVRKWFMSSIGIRKLQRRK